MINDEQNQIDQINNSIIDIQNVSEINNSLIFEDHHIPVTDEHNDLINGNEEQVVTGQNETQQETVINDEQNQSDQINNTIIDIQNISEINNTIIDIQNVSEINNSLISVCNETKELKKSDIDHIERSETEFQSFHNNDICIDELEGKNLIFKNRVLRMQMDLENDYLSDDLHILRFNNDGKSSILNSQLSEEIISEKTEGNQNLMKSKSSVDSENVFLFFENGSYNDGKSSITRNKVLVDEVIDDGGNGILSKNVSRNSLTFFGSKGVEKNSLLSLSEKQLKNYSSRKTFKKVLLFCSIVFLIFFIIFLHRLFFPSCSADKQEQFYLFDFKNFNNEPNPF